MTFNLWLTLLTIAVVLGAVLGIAAYLTLLERKIAAWVQDRKGPNRVGPWGLIQPLADGAKLILKEEVIPSHVDKLFYLMAPAIAIMTALLALAVVPFGPTTVPPPEVRAWPQTVEEAKTVRSSTALEKEKEYKETYQFVIAPGLDIGIVFVFAIGSLNVYAVILGGWSSNNKYSLLGSMRASAQMISYEIPMGMSILGVALLAGSLNLEQIINYQIPGRGGAGTWLFFYQPVACLLFITAIFAECNRLPFDLSECEQELVGGYHTEYSGMKFALFFFAEYTHMVTTSFLVMVLFFGGWHLPFLGDVGGVGGAILKVLILVGKMFLFIVFYMMVRWTLPRFRFDQLMGLAWKVLIPLSLINLVAVLFVKQFGLSVWVLLPVSFLLFVGAGYVTLLMPKPPAGPTQVKGRLTPPVPVAR